MTSECWASLAFGLMIVGCLLRWTFASDIIADPFTGSGTTLIACEQLGRVFRGLEIEPLYCDVIVRRWEEYTGKIATRVSATA